MDENTALDQRDRLPDALRVLLTGYPGDIWESHVNFDGLTRFWLERHLMFRELLGKLEAGAEAALDRRIDAQLYRHQTQRLAGMFLNQLHGHHMIEDHHYFPQLSALEPKLARGFEILDADHHALDGHIHALAETTNAMLRADAPAFEAETGVLHTALAGFGRFLDRHLTDEEDLIVPVILKHGAALEG